MRKSNFLVTMGALVCAVLVSSCSVNDDIEDNNDNGAVRFTAGIGEVATPLSGPGTRASETSWTSGDAIGIFMVANGGTSTVHAANKQYTTLTGGSNFTAASGDEIYYPQSGKVDFISYYPWKTGYVLSTPIDVKIATTQTAINQPTFDLLWAKADNSGSGYDKATNANDNVALVFDHKLAKIVMNCTADGSIGSALTGMIVTIKGMNTKNKFNLSTGALGTANTPATITPRTITDGSAYDAIIMPETYVADVVTVDFTISGETFTWKVPATTFAPGNEYTYAITITRTGVKFTGTINPWTPVQGDPGTAE